MEKKEKARRHDDCSSGDNDVVTGCVPEWFLPLTWKELGVGLESMSP